MPDRDKVIEELKELCEYLFHEYKVCYRGDEEDTYNRFLSANNALNLLKEQEPVKPVDQGDDSYVCDNCGETVGWEELDVYGIDPVRYKFCPGCGRKVKWGDTE